MVKKKDEEENNFILVSPPSKTKTYLNKKRTYKGSKIDWSQKQSAAKSLGDAGENFVIEREKKELEKNGLGDKADSVCKKEDGCGYDVRSFDKSGNEIHIEVKTTTGNIDEPFYMSINEKEFLEDHPKNYFLYRLHKFQYNPSRTKCYILSAKDFMNKTNLSAINFEVSIIN